MRWFSLSWRVATGVLACLLLGTASVSSAAPATSAGRPNPAPAADPAVTIVDYAFRLPELTITIGQTVIWTNKGGMVHTATSDTGVWDSGNLAPNESFSFKFTQEGVYKYYCAPHPFMQGTIRVVGSPTTAPAGMRSHLPLVSVP